MHALRDAVIPMITIAAGLLPILLSGSVILETVFNIPGLGKLSYTAAINKDLPLLNTIILISALLVQAGILMADIAYAWVDPRISFSARGGGDS